MGEFTSLLLRALWRTHRGHGLAACLVAFSLPSCAPKYDDEADKQITSVTQEGDKLIVTLENDYSNGKPSPYDASSYAQVEGDLKALGNRLKYSSNSDTQSVAPFSDTALTLIEELRKMHAAGNLPTLATSPHNTYLSDKEYNFNLNMGLLTNYEVLLKDGTSTGSAAQSTNAKAAAGAKH